MIEHYGFIRTPQCFLYKEAGEPGGTNSSPVEDEVFSGWAVRYVSAPENGWVRAETHYGYCGWLYAPALVPATRKELAERSTSSSLRAVAVPEADVLNAPKVQGSILETLPFCALVHLSPDDDEGGRREGWCRVRTYSGTEGWMQSAHLTERADRDGYFLDDDTCFRTVAARATAALSADEISELRRRITGTARRFLGTQYRWGGKSRRGIDCSGLVFMSYLANGLLIYRDASMPEGYPVRRIPRSALKEGDLLFFPGHVALYLGDDRYIHATGFAGTPWVTVNSLNLHDPDYRADLAESLTSCGSVFASAEQETAESPETAAFSEKEQLPAALTNCFADILPRLRSCPGAVSLLYKDLTTGALFRYQAEHRHPSASVIKLYLMAAMFQGFEDGLFRPEDRIPVPAEDFVPSCGVLTYLDAGKTVSLRDLVELMIIVSDNTACNILADFYGEERLQAYIRSLDLRATAWQRKMFDSARAARGLENFTSCDDTAWLLEQIFREMLVSPEASRQMLRMLEHQRLNGKIPFRLHAARPKPVIAHKTGENDGVSHDVALFEGDRPFLLLFMGSETDVPEWERMIGDLAAEIYEAHGAAF